MWLQYPDILRSSTLQKSMFGIDSNPLVPFDIDLKAMPTAQYKTNATMTHITNNATGDIGFDKGHE